MFVDKAVPPQAGRLYCFLISKALKKLMCIFAVLSKMETNQGYEIVVGLEVHARLLTRSKLFCGDSSFFGDEPNTNVSPITLERSHRFCR